MADDNVSATDKAEVELAPAAPPRFPCLACGRETKEHTTNEEGVRSRICAMPLCRNVQPA